jgi:Ca2+-binding EF-hand superfamily protein
MQMQTNMMHMKCGMRPLSAASTTLPATPASEASTTPGRSRSSSNVSTPSRLPFPDALHESFFMRFGQRQIPERVPLCLKQLSVELNCPLDVVKEANTLFRKYARRLFGDEESFIYQTKFHDLLKELMQRNGHELPVEEMGEKLHSCWVAADRHSKGCLSFKEFALWCSSSGFELFLLLTPQQITTRKLAKHHGFSIVEVEAVSEEFDKLDADGDGMLEYDEFIKLLCKLLEVPNQVGLPTTYLRQFWTEVDRDADGFVSFEEFFIWYAKYFEVRRALW